MEPNTENSPYCALFFSLMDKMLEKFIKENGQVIKIFNSSIILRDEHLSNQNGIEAVFRQDLLENRTLSCEYHFEKGIKKHIKLLSTEDQLLYKTLATSPKNVVTEEGST